MLTLPLTIPTISESLGVGFRDVLAFNPQAVPFEFPPQVEQGLVEARNVLGDLQVPSQADLEAIATGELDNFLSGARREVEDILGDLDISGNPLQSIEWLF